MNGMDEWQEKENEKMRLMEIVADGVTEKNAEIARLRSSLDHSIQHWHKTEAQLAEARNALTEILRMPSAGGHAKAAARKALKVIQ